MSEALRRKVLELYRDVDREVAAAGPVCVASGRCCRFKEYGHTLFLSNLEANVLLAAAPPLTPDPSPRSTGERGGSLSLLSPVLRGEGSGVRGAVTADYCPFQQGNLCTAREPRPLGCRVYYCDPNYQETGARITEKYLSRLKELADANGVPWLYAPLHHFLNHPEDARTDA